MVGATHRSRENYSYNNTISSLHFQKVTEGPFLPQSPCIYLTVTLKFQFQLIFFSVDPISNKTFFSLSFIMSESTIQSKEHADIGRGNWLASATPCNKNYYYFIIETNFFLLGLPKS